VLLNSGFWNPCYTSTSLCWVPFALLFGLATHSWAHYCENLLLFSDIAFAKNCFSSLNDWPFSTLPWQVGGLCSMARITIMLGSKRAAAFSDVIVIFGLVWSIVRRFIKLGKLTPIQFTRNLVPTMLRSFWIIGYLYTHRKAVQAELKVCVLYSFSLLFQLFS